MVNEISRGMINRVGKKGSFPRASGKEGFVGKISCRRDPDLSSSKAAGLSVITSIPILLSSNRQM